MKSILSFNCWIPGGRSQVRTAIKLCEHNICRYPNLGERKRRMPDLPIPRIMSGHFEATCVDFVGPFIVIRCGTGKFIYTCSKCLKKMKAETTTGKCSTQKVYICIFACHSSRAVHLELLQDKMRESFLLAIKGMANRRSMPRIMRSDNASE